MGCHPGATKDVSFDHEGSFECLQCKLKFHMEPGTLVKCPRCKHLYVKWLDYPRFEKERRRKGLK